MTGDMIITAGIGAFSSIGGAGVAWWMLKNEYLDLRREVKDLRDRELVNLIHRVGKIEDGCKAETHAQQINDMKPALARIEGKVDSTSKEISELNGKLESWEGWIGDVRKESRDTKDRLIDHLSDHGGAKRHA